MSYKSYRSYWVTFDSFDSFDLFDLFDSFDLFDLPAPFLRFFATLQFLNCLCGLVSENLF